MSVRRAKQLWTVSPGSTAKLSGDNYCRTPQIPGHRCLLQTSPDTISAA